MPHWLVLLAALVVTSAAVASPTPPDDAPRPASTPSTAVSAALTVPSDAHLTYYGGPVLSNVKVAVIFWNDASKVNFAVDLAHFCGNGGREGHVMSTSEFGNDVASESANGRRKRS